MKKIAWLFSVMIGIAVLVLLAGTAVSAGELVIAFSGDMLNNGEAVGGDTGGAAYVDAEGGYRSLIHGVNTGVRPIKNYFAEIFSPDGEDLVLRYRVKILSDDQTTAETTRVFGFYPILMGDGTTLNDEAGDALIFTAGELRAMEKEENGWFYVYYVIESERFSLTDHDMVEVNNQVYYNGAKNSGCAIDIAVAEIAVYIGDPRAPGGEPGGTDAPASDSSSTAPTETSPAMPDSSTAPETTAESPEETAPADDKPSSDSKKPTKESNLPLYISGAAVLLVAAGCTVYLILLKRKYAAGKKRNDR